MSEIPSGGNIQNGMKASVRTLLFSAGGILLLFVAGSLLMSRLPEEVSAPLFTLVVILEVVIAPIPGGAIGYMGAARYGFWQAWPLLYIGNVIGTILVFFLARKVGGPLFEASVSPKNRARYDHLLRNNILLLWLVYSVPLIPVDILSVFAGISSISAKKFLSIALTGYILYTAIVAYVGAFVAQAIGVAETVSMLGGVILLFVAIWAWRSWRTASNDQ
ncbi:MAG: VTT domain-containing protein [Gemmatimonadota bacterium]|jgi:uncharacterized membrane protein YdjX (TVP38/TMEM64 family)|nr:VTT domain-containing protein [Gemmatimonadota bacterium]